MMFTAYLEPGYMKHSATFGRVVVNVFIGFLVGLAGGLVGLGGAELRLPYLAGTAVSLITLLAALPTRLSPSSLLKAMLGVILIVSSIKVRRRLR